MNNKYIKLLVLILLVVIVIVSIIKIITRPIVKEYINIDHDSDNEEFILDNGRLMIWNDDKRIFISDALWTVNNFDYTDCNNDGIDELMIGFWRIGDYGVDNPYARTRRDPKPSYHLFLYQYMIEAEHFRLIWGSSTLNDPIYSLSVEEISTDNNILKVIRGSYEDYDDKGILDPLEISYWIWEDWYFKEL